MAYVVVTPMLKDEGSAYVMDDTSGKVWRVRLRYQRGEELKGEWELISEGPGE